MLQLTVTEPAVMFSGISLLFLAYTNRYLALANVMRILNKELKDQEKNLVKQIQNLHIRIQLIKYMQVFGIISFLFCIASMMMIYLGLQLLGNTFFMFSLVAMVVSLFLSLAEVLKSGKSLRIELDRTHVRDQWEK